MQKVREFLVEGMNYYVPGMQAGADLGQLLQQRLDFGTPVLADADGILDGLVVTSAGETTTFAATYSSDAMSRYGRCVSVLAGVGANTDVTIVGRDYLGQPMREVLTLNGVTPVVGLKAFKYIDKVINEAEANGPLDVGWNDKLGLPYKGVAVEREYADGVAAAAGTFVAPVLTDPQTTTTGDPRGTYDPTTALDGSTKIEIDIQYSNAVNSDGNGGLHGIRHFNT